MNEYRLAKDLTIEELTDIRDRVNNGESKRSVAADYGLSHSNAAMNLITGMEYAGYFDGPAVEVETTQPTPRAFQVTVKVELTHGNIADMAAAVQSAVYETVQEAVQAALQPTTE